MAKTICGARSKRGGICRAPPVPGKKRCRMHGGNNTGPKTPEAKAAWAKMAHEARKRFYDKMREAKAMGLITHMKAPNPPRLPKLIEKAKAVIQTAKADLAQGQPTLADHLVHVTGKSLDVCEHIVNYKMPKRKPKGDALKLMTLQKETALGIINAQIKVNENELRGRRADVLAPLLAALLDASAKPKED